MENNSQDGGSPSRTTQMPVQMMNQMSEQLNAIHRDQQHIRNERDNDREETRAQVQALESAIATPNHTSSEDIVNSVLQRLGLVPLVLNTTSPANIHSPQQGQLPAKKKPTLPNPQRLDRTRKLFCPWLLQMRSKLHVDGPALGGSFDQFVYIYSQLDKTPQAIAAAYLEKGGLDGLSNPVDFLKYMSTCYADPNIEQRALSRLETIRQGPQENFAIFLPKFEKELADSGGASWDNAVKINFLKRVISGELPLQSLGANLDELRFYNRSREQSSGQAKSKNQVSKTKNSFQTPAGEETPSDPMDWDYKNREGRKQA
ncbi:hypothetical protein MAA_11706 [Metarhizium robertsii ARSEF 23]|uniref:Retrotransposon gag protein n=1 Tax=Metarhizium robertsii (strain ARSEF 23 / ATCC MYA-3075) TaxID=655844 RepID=A0A0B2XGN4_METRA|nr:uncharacterized protein MAA_11706 [Metarhizium robertsii ARSEF 23]KHO10702.1 hypothetical protein MAA_11706 [Metarhizium robertsii ARSEF 23]